MLRNPELENSSRLHNPAAYHMGEQGRIEAIIRNREGYPPCSFIRAILDLWYRIQEMSLPSFRSMQLGSGATATCGSEKSNNRQHREQGRTDTCGCRSAEFRTNVRPCETGGEGDINSSGDIFVGTNGYVGIEQFPTKVEPNNCTFVFPDTSHTQCALILRPSEVSRRWKTVGAAIIHQ